METKISKWGNSQGVRLPKRMLSQIGINDDDGQISDQVVDMTVVDGKIVIEKSPETSKLAQLFEGFDLEKYNQEHQGSRELDWGEDVGNEIF